MKKEDEGEGMFVWGSLLLDISVCLRVSEDWYSVQMECRVPFHEKERESLEEVSDCLTFFFACLPSLSRAYLPDLLHSQLMPAAEAFNWQRQERYPLSSACFTMLLHLVVKGIVEGMPWIGVIGSFPDKCRLQGIYYRYIQCCVHAMGPAWNEDIRWLGVARQQGPFLSCRSQGSRDSSTEQGVT